MRTMTARTERRRSRRYRPPAGFRPELRRTGWRGLLDANLCAACLNLSEGGVRVLLTRPLEEGGTLRGRFDGVEVELRARYAVPAAKDGRWEAGLVFVSPDPAFRQWLRGFLIRCSPILADGRDAWGAAR